MVGQIWASYRRMPGWVQVWVALVLVPVNLLPLALLGGGGVYPWEGIAVLSVGGMAANLPIMIVERGLSRAMALPHVLLWTPLVIWGGLMLWAAPGAPGAVVLGVILAVDMVSLGFDYPDAVKWWRGDRRIA